MNGDLVALPAGGRVGAPPICPYPLGAAGDAWWQWAWRTPQATRWDAGALYVVARRARLEDTDPEDGLLPVFREMRELDARLGLTPKGLADLGWVIGGPEEVDSLDQLASRRAARRKGSPAA